jgi:hypothetical protein
LQGTEAFPRLLYHALHLPMPPPPTTFLFCRSQAIFHASVVLDGLPDIDKSWIDRLSVHIDSPGKIMLDSWLGKGPTTHELAPFVALYFRPR